MRESSVPRTPPLQEREWVSGFAGTLAVRVERWYSERSPFCGWYMVAGACA
ncbi:MAG: hypothetical protein GF410_14060 [Chitinivibrionales bacterium]|nr:hypothetical protein [Chitinivibrionales bacterium]